MTATIPPDITPDQLRAAALAADELPPALAAVVRQAARQVTHPDDIVVAQFDSSI